MPTDLLLDLPAPSPSVDVLSRLEREVGAVTTLRDIIVEELDRYFAGLKGSAETFQRGWQRLVLAVADKQTERAQAIREIVLVRPAIVITPTQEITPDVYRGSGKAHSDARSQVGHQMHSAVQGHWEGLWVGHPSEVCR